MSSELMTSYSNFEHIYIADCYLKKHNLGKIQPNKKVT